MAANLDDREKVKIFGKLTIVGTFECLKEIEVWGNLTIHGYMYDLSRSLSLLSLCTSTPAYAKLDHGILDFYKPWSTHR